MTEGPGPEPPDERRVVKLLAAPVVPLVQIQAWLDDTFRELRLVERSGSDQGVPPRLRSLAGNLHDIIDRARSILARQVAEAAAGGQDVADLEFDVGPRAVAEVARLLVILDEIDEHSRAGGLLTPPRTPEMVGVLRWIGREVVGQIEVGRAPRPFRPARA